MINLVYYLLSKRGRPMSYDNINFYLHVLIAVHVKVKAVSSGGIVEGVADDQIGDNTEGEDDDGRET